MKEKTILNFISVVIKRSDVKTNTVILTVRYVNIFSFPNIKVKLKQLFLINSTVNTIRIA